MGMFGAMDAASSGVTLGRTWLDATASNIANADTVTRTGQQPFRAEVVLAQARGGEQGVDVAGIARKGGAPEVVYDPQSPLADGQGYVVRPQVDLTEEMTNLLMAQRLYQANLSVMQTARDAYQQALKIGSSQ